MRARPSSSSSRVAHGGVGFVDQHVVGSAGEEPGDGGVDVVGEDPAEALPLGVPGSTSAG